MWGRNSKGEQREETEGGRNRWKEMGKEDKHKGLEGRRDGRANNEGQETWEAREL